MRVDGWVAIEGPYLFRGPDGPAALSQLPSFTTVALAVPSNCPAPRNSSVNLTNGHGDAVSWYHGPLWKLTGGVQLVVNMQTSVAGFVAIELQGENGLALPGYSLDEADKLKGNALDAVASWRNGSLASLSLLAGTNVSVRAVLPSAKLFSIKLACADASKTDDTGSDFSRQGAKRVMLWAGHPCMTTYPWPRDHNCTDELINTMLRKLAPLRDVVDSIAIVQSFYVADPANASMVGFNAGLVRQPHLDKVVAAYKAAGWTVESVIGDIDPTLLRPGRIQQARMKIENCKRPAPTLLCKPSTR